MPKGTKTAQRDSESRLSWLLSVVHGPGFNGTKHHVLGNPFVRLDRTSRAQPTIRLEDPAVSTDGAHIERTDDGNYKIVDDGSRNGIRVNGNAVSDAVLEPQDVVRIGDTLLVVDRTDPSRRGRQKGWTQLLHSLCMFESTARFVFEGDARFVDDEVCGVAIVTDGFTESRQVSAWLAGSWGLEVLRIDAAAAGASTTVRNAGDDVVVLVERVDSLDIVDLSELADAIEERPSRPGHRVIFSYSNRADAVAIERMTEVGADVVLNVPSLAHRRADILPAIRHQLVQLDVDLDSVELPPDSAEKLLCYDWPGGIGELKRAARRIYKELAEEGKITGYALPAEIRAVPVSPEVDRPRWFDKETFAAAFAEYNGNMKEIAAHFGYARTYLYRVLRQRNIDVGAVRARVLGTEE